MACFACFIQELYNSFQASQFLIFLNILPQTKFLRRSEFCHNSVAESNSASAQTFITFFNRTSIYTKTLVHHHKGRLESRLGLVYLLETSKIIFSAAEVIFLMFLAEYSAAEALGFSYWPNLYIGI